MRRVVLTDTDFLIGTIFITAVWLLCVLAVIVVQNKK